MFKKILTEKKEFFITSINLDGVRIIVGVS